MKEIAHCKQYEHFKWKRTCVANITKDLNERKYTKMNEDARHEHYIGFKRGKMRVANTKNAKMKLYVRDHTSF